MMDAVNDVKDIEVNGNAYRINRFDAKTGSFLALKFANKLLEILKNSNEEESKPSDTDDADDAAKRTVTLLFMQFDEAEFNLVQKHALNVVFRLQPITNNEPVFMPIVRQGRYEFADLAKDAQTITALTQHALMFNLAPFFQKSVLQNLLTLR